VRDGVTGFAFSEFSADACWNALARAIHIWRVDRDGWRSLQAHGMSQDFSWHTSARSYALLYEWADRARARRDRSA
jgi:starch synthase